MVNDDQSAGVLRDPALRTENLCLSCMAMAETLLPEPMRAKPPGMICQPSRVRAAKTRSDIGRGTSLPSTKAGVVESVTASWPTSLAPSVVSPFGYGLLCGIAQAGAEHGLLVVVEEGTRGIGRADDHALDIARDVLALLLLAAPPGGDGRKALLFAEQMPADVRQEGSGRRASRRCRHRAH